MKKNDSAWCDICGRGNNRLDMETTTRFLERIWEITSRLERFEFLILKHWQGEIPQRSKEKKEKK